MIDILETWLRPNDVGLEFGSGRSTIWLARRIKQLTSVENDPGWYTKVKELLQEAGGEDLADRVDYHLCEGELDYINIAKSMKTNSLDFCLIDGTARDHCALASLDKLKPGGILVIDNIDRYIPKEKPSFAPNSRSLEEGYASSDWRIVGEQLKNWRGIWTSNGVTDTALWVRPVA